MVELRGGVSGPLGLRHLGGSVSVSPRLSVLVPLHAGKFRRYWATVGTQFWVQPFSSFGASGVSPSGNELLRAREDPRKVEPHVL